MPGTLPARSGHAVNTTGIRIVDGAGMCRNKFGLTRGPLIDSSFRRRPESMLLKPLDPGIRRDDKQRINQLPLSMGVERVIIAH